MSPSLHSLIVAMVDPCKYVVDGHINLPKTSHLFVASVFVILFTIVYFKALLKLVKSFVLLIWETRKKELYGDQDCVVSGCSCSCPLTGGLTSSACVCGCVVNGVSATAAA